MKNTLIVLCKRLLISIIIKSYFEGWPLQTDKFILKLFITLSEYIFGNQKQSIIENRKQNFKIDII